MANSLETAPNGPGGGEVSHCISNILHAFSNGLDIFKRLRERRKKRKSRKPIAQIEQESSAELQLSTSLRKGPQEIQESYRHHYGQAGDRFAEGDAIAHASLAQTLIRLNTGLVGIIASFLSHDTKSSHASLDYKSLTNLSNSSRTEAIDSLNQLYRRLSQSQLQLSRIGGCPHCGSTRHQNCTTGQTKKSSNKKAHTSSRARTNGPVITRMPIRSSNQAQLVVLRPRNTRKSSLSSSSSTKSPSTTTHTPYSTSPIGSPLGSPLPQYAKKDPFPPQKHTGKAKSTSQKRTDSMDAHRPSPTAWPHVATDVSMPLHLPPPRLPSPQKSPPPHERNTLKRRMDKVTPSTYTFASDSTKLGEIPQRNWIKPFDYEEAERLNQEALVNGYPLPMVEGKPKKKGLFGFLRRSPAVVS